MASLSLINFTPTILPITNWVYRFCVHPQWRGLSKFFSSILRPPEIHCPAAGVYIFRRPTSHFLATSLQKLATGRILVRNSVHPLEPIHNIQIRWIFFPSLSYVFFFNVGYIQLSQLYLLLPCYNLFDILSFS